MQRRQEMTTAAGSASIYRSVSVIATQLLEPACGPTCLRSQGDLYSVVMGYA